MQSKIELDEASTSTSKIYSPFVHVNSVRVEFSYFSVPHWWVQVRVDCEPTVISVRTGP